MAALGLQVTRLLEDLGAEEQIGETMPGDARSHPQPVPVPTAVGLGVGSSLLPIRGSSNGR